MKYAKEKNVEVLISKAPPLNTKEHKTWANHMLRIQIAMWVDDGRKCGQCNKAYKSVDDWIARKPKRGYGKAWKEFFIDNDCWEEYLKKKGKKK